MFISPRSPAAGRPPRRGGYDICNVQADGLFADPAPGASPPMHGVCRYHPRWLCSVPAMGRHWWLVSGRILPSTIRLPACSAGGYPGCVCASAPVTYGDDDRPCCFARKDGRRGRTTAPGTVGRSRTCTHTHTHTHAHTHTFTRILVRLRLLHQLSATTHLRLFSLLQTFCTCQTMARG